MTDTKTRDILIIRSEMTIWWPIINIKPCGIDIYLSELLNQRVRKQANTMTLSFRTRMQYVRNTTAHIQRQP